MTMLLCQPSYSSSPEAVNRPSQSTSLSSKFAAPAAFLAFFASTYGMAANGQSTLSVTSRTNASEDEALRERVAERLAMLHECAEDDGISLSMESEKLIKAFVFRNAKSAPAIVCTDDGNLRAIWRNRKNEQLALIFRSLSEVQFVFFIHRGENMDRASGVTSFSDVMQLVRAHGVGHLLKG